MALQNKREELLVAWRALTGNSLTKGWRTIPVFMHGGCTLRAGRYFPGNEEAILFGFLSIHVPSFDHLPQGRGFIIQKADLGGEEPMRVWIALCRQSAGNSELFTMMAEDVITTMEGLRGISDETLFQIFLERIRAWQKFMLQGKDDILSAESEIGLYGELEMLSNIISLGVAKIHCIDAWQGPLDGVHDFVFGNGAIEVKSSVSPVGFLAKISSLEQLDDSIIRPLFLSCVRLELNNSGQTLSEKIGHLRHLLQDDAGALSLFNSRLLYVGFLDSSGERYTRRFVTLGIRIMHVTDKFPRLTRANVAIEIRIVRYEIDLDLFPAEDIGLLNAMTQLGILNQWN